MKIVKTASGEEKVEATYDEWLRVGEQKKWVSMQKTASAKPGVTVSVPMVGLLDSVSTSDIVGIRGVNHVVIVDSSKMGDDGFSGLLQKAVSKNDKLQPCRVLSMDAGAMARSPKACDEALKKRATAMFTSANTIWKVRGPVANDSAFMKLARDNSKTMAQNNAWIVVES